MQNGRRMRRRDRKKLTTSKCITIYKYIHFLQVYVGRSPTRGSNKQAETGWTHKQWIAGVIYIYKEVRMYAANRYNGVFILGQHNAARGPLVG